VFNNTLIGQEIKVGGSKPNHPKDCKIANNIGKVNAGGNAIVSEGNLDGNPLTMQDGIYRLLANPAGAAAIGKAVNTAAYMLTDDIDGQARNAPDVGADEQSPDPVKFKGPLTMADVGPDSP